MKLDRRQFLQGASALLAVPYMEALAPRGSKIPVRAAWIYFPNGVSSGRWRPKQAGSDGQLKELHPSMAPLERHRENLLITRRMFTPNGNGHGGGTATWLTGGEWHHREMDAGGKSVDRILGDAFQEECVVPSLALSARGEGFFAADIPRNTLSWDGPGRPVFRETDPAAAFQLLFGTGPRADQSLLDDLREQAKNLRDKVSRADRERLDAYLEAIRGLERRLAFVADENVKRRLEAAPKHGLSFGSEGPPSAIPEDHGEYLDLLLDLTALALWSGASRAASVMLDHGQSNRYCTFIPGVKGTWHALSHWKDHSGDTEDDDGVTTWKSRNSKRDMYDAVVTWHHERLARFLDRLAALPEADGNLLQHAMITYGSSLSDGHEHGEEDLPVLVAGQGGGAVRSGRYLKLRENTDLSRLHLATLRAAGVRRRELGEADEPLGLR